MGKQFASLLKVPNLDGITDGTDSTEVNRNWEVFFRGIVKALLPLGLEKSFQLVNNQAVAADITGMNLTSQIVSHGIFEYLIQRVTTGAGAVELLEAGMFHLVFRPTSNLWVIVVIGSPGPSISGVTFSVTAKGQVQYTSVNIGGTPSISKITWRVRTLAAKNSQYSKGYA
jgi:hypothetical protein